MRSNSEHAIRLSEPIRTFDPVLWKRHDVPSHETCRLVQLASGWRLEGATVQQEGDAACRLDYTIDCDAAWRTRTAIVRGWVGRHEIDVHLACDNDGGWRLGEIECPLVTGCVDIDLNFSPATNLLPIRRLDLAIGTEASVRAAWLRFPSFLLEPLEQTYARIGEREYRYTSAGGRFVAPLSVDEQGLIVTYGTYWSRERGS